MASVAFLVTLKASSTDAVHLPSPFWTGSKTDPNGREFQWFALPLALGPDQVNNAAARSTRDQT